ncbi:MAG: GntR family transcriptional regulator [Defluviitaleaceae bacterium]|nr:GntR family transcriptional regulator [Defluviitaleaceae bacterium]MCL2263422.1 GntR family transcriptional regulator [Defluviitaleaceae bacterium]
MFKIDLKNRKPIYEQVVENFKRLIISGELGENSRVPSIRDMAKELGVNPNTVQKAYRELEGQRYFYTVAGQGSFISAPPEAAGEIAALYEKLAAIVRELIFRGEGIGEIGLYINGLGSEKVND